MIGYGASVSEVQRGVAERAKQLRVLRNLRQDELATRAGIGIATLQRFEKTGNSSFENVLRIATALAADAAFDKLFEAPAYRSIDEALARPSVATRRRVRKPTTTRRRKM